MGLRLEFPGIHPIFWAKSDLSLSAVLLLLKRAGLKQWVHSMGCNCSSFALGSCPEPPVLFSGLSFCDGLVREGCCSHKLTGVLQPWASSEQHSARSELTHPKHSSCPMSGPSTEQDFLKDNIQAQEKHRKIFQDRSGAYTLQEEERKRLRGH